MDSAIANNKKFNNGDSAYIFNRYWDNNPEIRRKKLLPFLWDAFNSNGQIYGNRNYGNLVNNANPYWFSYPGYNELLTGFVDTAINTNEYPPNPNINLLEFLNSKPFYKNKVAAFGAWDAFDRILNEGRSRFPVQSSFDTLKGNNLSSTERLLNLMITNSYKPWENDECLDVFTHYMALNYLQTKKPKILYIAYGETDEWAHAANYKSYLNAAAQVDKWINEIWDYIQQDKQYKNKTAIVFTTDHGRGLLEKWTSHNNKVEHSNEMWFAVLAPGIKTKGEMKNKEQYYQKQLAQTIAKMLGLEFKTNHPVASEVKDFFK
jgi:Sulfatase